MALFEDHLYNGQYPYLTPEEFTADKSKCKIAQGADPEDENVIDAIMDASLVLYYMTGRQFNGTTQTTVTPHCECYDCAPHRLTMGLWPITAIISVREDGEDRSGNDYHIDEYRYIVKDDGTAFPRCGNWYAEVGSEWDNEEDGWVFEVTVEHGIPAPRLLKRAVSALACNLYSLNVDDCEDCDLPERITSMSRQGVSFEIADFVALMERGSTGIYAVDLAVKVLNPSGLQSPSFVWTPELERGIRRYISAEDVS